MILSKGLWLLGLSVIALAVWGNSYYNDIGLLYRVIGVIVLFLIGLSIIRFTHFGSSAFKTILDSAIEIRKVVWPTRMETTQTFMIVFAAIIILCLFFWGLESLLSFLTGLALG